MEQKPLFRPFQNKKRSKKAEYEAVRREVFNSDLAALRSVLQRLGVDPKKLGGSHNPLQYSIKFLHELLNLCEPATLRSLTLDEESRRSCSFDFDSPGTKGELFNVQEEEKGSHPLESHSGTPQPLPESEMDPVSKRESRPLTVRKHVLNAQISDRIKKLANELHFVDLAASHLPSPPTSTSPPSELRTSTTPQHDERFLKRSRDESSLIVPSQPLQKQRREELRHPEDFTPHPPHPQLSPPHRPYHTHTSQSSRLSHPDAPHRYPLPSHPARPPPSRWTSYAPPPPPPFTSSSPSSNFTREPPPPHIRRHWAPSHQHQSFDQDLTYPSSHLGSPIEPFSCEAPLDTTKLPFEFL